MIELTESETEIMLTLSSRISVDPSDDPELFCKQAKELSYEIPQRIRDILHDFVSVNSLNHDFLLFKNVPVNNVPVNNVPVIPVTNNIGEKTVLAKVQSILIHVMGEMISYEAEGYGRLFQDVVPVKTMAKNQTSIGSNVELEIHTEQAFSKLRPDILSLACIRGDPEAYTYILPLYEIINHISSDELDLLSQPLWKTGVDLSFKLNGQEFIEGDIRGPLAIIQGTEDPFLVFDQDLMVGITEEADDIIKKIIDIYYRYRLEHNLVSGEILFINNRRVVHGRSPFFPKYNGFDRFLVRCFAVFDYESSAYARKGRMVQAIYS